METSPNPSAWSRIVEILRPQLIERLQIRDLADPESTIEGIKKDIEFRGFNLWILVFSIVIASIGLNVDSTAVVIGAMLISPLMGPIMGFGLGVGINDAGTVRKSLINLGVAAGIAVLSSAIYFLISPIDEAGSELFARTNPTFLDVLVALFGGLTGILAGSRKEKSNVIPGVAIATALMPPLCTAGFGLANGEWEYFFGAFYLFLINAILIATATTLVVRYLNFPQATFVDPVRERKYKRYFAVALLALVIPSGWIFYKTVSETVVTSRIDGYVTEHAKFPGMEVVKSEIVWVSGAPHVHLVLLGEFVPESLVDQWTEGLAEAVPDAVMHVVQNTKDATGLAEMTRLIDLYSEGREALALRDDQIRLLREELATATRQLSGLQLPPSLGEEIQLQHPAVQGARMGLIRATGSDGSTPWVEVLWSPSSDSMKWDKRDAQRIESWLRVRLGDSAAEIKHVELEVEGAAG
ncbi:MAG: TIGR00341 family protein [Flavobacteriales bacterium]